MFEEQNKTNGVEDILADAEAPATPQTAGPLGPPSALAQGKLQPIQPGAARPAVSPAQTSAVGRAARPVKKIIAAVVVVLLVGGAVGAGYVWWPGRGAAPSASAPALGQPDQGAASSQADNIVNQTLEQFQQNSIEQALNPLVPNLDGGESKAPVETSLDAKTDTDQDNLSDVDEAVNGTNPRLVDTDDDGLSDWEEVSVFGTNPLAPDTDGDTYPDGSEVQNGYNPKGAGKLLDFEQAKSKVSN